ncbi:MAG: biotin/lipoyl-containing protein [candidate division WOR-3 bacterium]
MKRIGRWFIHNGHKFYFVKVKGGYEVFYKGRVYSIRKDLKVSGDMEEYVEDEIKAPMTGRLVSLKVKKGQEVKKDQALAVIEAMKMEIILSAPKDAIVEDIFKNEGEIVNKNEIVIKLSFLE